MHSVGLLTVVYLPEKCCNANLQEFSARVSYVCDLETFGISTEDAYKQISELWQLERSYVELGFNSEN